MAARKSSRVKPVYKKRYRVENWPEYEAGLRARGDLEIWFDEDTSSAWTPGPNGKRGTQQLYSEYRDHDCADPSPGLLPASSSGRRVRRLAPAIDESRSRGS